MNRSPFKTHALQRAVGVFALLAGLAVVPMACSSSTTTPDAGAQDSGPVDAGFVSACGQPGDLAVNDAGIGLFCESTADCPGSTLCSNIYNIDGGAEPFTFFCVQVCNQCDAPDFCGPGATCICQPPGCGCTPNRCSAIFPDGGNPPCDAG